MTNRTKTKSQLSAQGISRELENEGINWSIKKVKRVADALKTLMIAYLAAVNLDNLEETKQTLTEEIQARSAI